MENDNRTNNKTKDSELDLDRTVEISPQNSDTSSNQTITRKHPGQKSQEDVATVHQTEGLENQAIANTVVQSDFPEFNPDEDDIFPDEYDPLPEFESRKPLTRKTIVQGLVYFLPALAVIGVCFIGYITTQIPKDSKRSDFHSFELLKDNTKVIEAFYKSFNKLPNNLGLLRPVATKMDLSFSMYDASNQRIEFLTLNQSTYLMRSFGSDARENTLLSPVDPTTTNWNPNTKLGLQNPLFSPRDLVRTFPSALLLSSLSADQKFLAKLFLNNTTGERRIVVTNSGDADTYFISRHDHINELVWLNDSRKIIYSATGSSRYADGIYLWDLETQTTHNLLKDLYDKLNPTARRRGFYIQTVGTLNQQTPVFVIYENTTSLLSPHNFYQRSNYFFYSTKQNRLMLVPNTNSGHIQPNQRQMLTIIDAHQDIDWKQNSQIEPLPLQKEMLQLPTQGGVNDVIEPWQNFTSRQQGTALEPYCLLFLALVYTQAYESSDGDDSAAGELLRTYAMELANKLTKLKTSPGYINGMAQYIFEQLQVRNRVNVKVVEFY